MNENHIAQGEGSIEHAASGTKDVGNAARELCEKALEDAKRQMHPLLHQSGLDHLSLRVEFLDAFKTALEKRVALTLAAWQPGVQAVFKYDRTPMSTAETWDGSIHLLVKVPRVSDSIRALGRKLDRSLIKCFRQIGWKRFQTLPSILEVHQVTPSELRHGVGYGAMFYAVYTVPVKVWPPDRRTR